MWLRRLAEGSRGGIRYRLVGFAGRSLLSAVLLSGRGWRRGPSLAVAYLLERGAGPAVRFSLDARKLGPYGPAHTGGSRENQLTRHKGLPHGFLAHVQHPAKQPGPVPIRPPRPQLCRSAWRLTPNLPRRAERRIRALRCAGPTLIQGAQIRLFCTPGSLLSGQSMPRVRRVLLVGDIERNEWAAVRPRDSFA
jgi:hypothetical protein